MKLYMYSAWQNYIIFYCWLLVSAPIGYHQANTHKNCLNDSVGQVNVSFSMLCCEGTKKLANSTNLINDIKRDQNVSAETKQKNILAKFRLQIKTCDSWEFKQFQK